MAEGKKSFIAYCDWKETFDALPDEKAGQLVKHLFSYVNDENPQTEDILIKAVFANIKHQLKRDLSTWESKRNQQSGAGLSSALSKLETKLKLVGIDEAKRIEGEIQQKITEGNEGDYYPKALELVKRFLTKSTTVERNQRPLNTVESRSTKSTVNVNDTVNVTVNVNEISNSIEGRKLAFAHSLNKFSSQYSESMLNDFKGYWTEHGDNDRKMRFEKEKSFSIERRLSVWKKKEKEFSPKPKTKWISPI